MMSKNRLEAFSDGVIAIVITIMVLELKVPHGATFAAVIPLWPKFLSYVLSFAHLGIYWNNHHHLLQVTQRVSGATLWANLHLLFWLSLVPFVTGWMGENHFAPLPTALYGAVLLMSGVSYSILVRTLLAQREHHTVLAQAIGKDIKGIGSLALYATAIPTALTMPWLAGGIYALVALIWFIPDRRIERALAAQPHQAAGHR